jgi:hypothetical protein
VYTKTSTNFVGILYFRVIPFMVYYAPCFLLHCFIRPPTQHGQIACGLYTKRNLKCFNKSSSFLCTRLLMLGFVCKVHSGSCRITSERRIRAPTRSTKTRSDIRDKLCKPPTCLCSLEASNLASVLQIPMK